MTCQRNTGFELHLSKKFQIKLKEKVKRKTTFKPAKELEEKTLMITVSASLQIPQMISLQFIMTASNSTFKQSWQASSFRYETKDK